MFDLGDFEEKYQSKSKEYKETFLEEIDVRLKTLVLNQVTYKLKMNLRKKYQGTS